jgi:hypothetical protein
MPIVTADSYGIDFTGATDVTVALAAAINAQPSGNTFQLHPGGLYLTNSPMTLTPTNVIIDGQGAFTFRNVRRSGDSGTHSDIVIFNGPDSTLRDLSIYGFRKDVYTGDKLTTVTGSPLVSGTTVLLDALNEEVRLPQTPLDYFATPTPGPTNFETPFYFRGVDGLVRFEATLSDTTHVANDCVFSIVDDSNGTTLATATANVITVGDITPYGEAGYRRHGVTAFPIPQGGGNEFQDAIHFSGAANMTVDNVWAEGPDGDGFNLTSAGVNCQVLNSTVRGAGRQCYTIEFSTSSLIDNCVGREGGRSGVDFEPQGGSPNNLTTISNCTFINIRNYTIAMGPLNYMFDVTLSNITSVSSGMGPMFGGGTRVTITNFVHSQTTRDEADRVHNGGRAGIDAIIQGIDVTADNFTTDIGFWLKMAGVAVPFGNNIHITNARALHPTLVPPYIIDVPNSSVSTVSDVVAGVWDDPLVFWDSPDWTWDGTFIGTVVPFEPAFQGTAFQNDAFQASPVVFATIAQTLAGFTQELSGLSARIATIAQDGPAFTQAADAAVVVGHTITQTLTAFTQEAAADIIVSGIIGSRVQAFQPDAFQDDAFQIGADMPVYAPSFTQHLSGGVVPHGTTVGIIAQTLAGFTQALDAGQGVQGQIAQVAAGFTQDSGHPGKIFQTAPAFAQALIVGIEVNALGAITQIAPAFTQSLHASLVSWGEWPVGTGDEWLVGISDEWLVRQ